MNPRSNLDAVCRCLGFNTGQAAEEFARFNSEMAPDPDPHAGLVARLHRFLEFCTADVPRYQLLFQSAIPGFEPSAASYAPAVRALEHARAVLAGYGIDDPRHVDMWTALVTGLADQQISNDPGGDRWSRLADEIVSMYLAHCLGTKEGVDTRTPR